ncbi:MAG: TIR domain-containing protein [Aureispira sp.]
MSQPKIFIGSSSEGIRIADGIETNLEYDCTSYKWSNVFKSGMSNLENLIKVLEDMDFAAFVFSPDDVLKMRGTIYSAARDNVIFELGLFMGLLGRERTFIIHPKNQTNFHLPSDLNGIGILQYNESQTNYKIKTSIICNEIRDIVTKLGKKN